MAIVPIDVRFVCRFNAIVFGGRVFVLLGLALAAASCVESGNYGWDLGRWEPPPVAGPEVEAFRGVHEGRIGLRCRKGGEPALFVETWRPLVPVGAPAAAIMTYRLDGAEHSGPGRLGPRGFEFAVGPALLRRLSEASRLEALVPVHGGGVFPVTFDIGDFARAHEWVRGECAQL